MINKAIAIACILSMLASLPAYAGLDSSFKDVEEELINTTPTPKKYRDIETDLEGDAKKSSEKVKEMKDRYTYKKKTASSGSSWWKWTIGILVLGGAAAAGGGGGDESPPPSSDTGTVTATW